VPGLKIVAPAIPLDAKGFIKAAIRDDNPALCFEHKFLYRRIKQDLPGDEEILTDQELEHKRILLEQLEALEAQMDID